MKSCRDCRYWDESDMFDKCSKRPGTSTVICFMFTPREKKEDKK